jgi:hypothetical protein
MQFVFYHKKKNPRSSFFGLTWPRKCQSQLIFIQIKHSPGSVDKVDNQRGDTEYKDEDDLVDKRQ